MDTSHGVVDAIPYESPDQVARVIHDAYLLMMWPTQPGDKKYTLALARNFTMAEPSLLPEIEAAVTQAFSDLAVEFLDVRNTYHIDDSTVKVTNIAVHVAVQIDG